MENQTLPEDFREFLRLLQEADVQYLLIGGYAVGFHGYPRTTADIDIWVATDPGNASKLLDELSEDASDLAIFNERADERTMTFEALSDHLKRNTDQCPHPAQVHDRAAVQRLIDTEAGHSRADAFFEPD